MKQTFTSLGGILRTLVITSSTMFIVQTDLSAAVMLDYALPGTEQYVTWTSLSSANPSLTPATGTGTLSVASPGYQASAGFYSFGGDYSTTASTGSYAGDIKNVIFQLDWAPNTTENPVGAPLLSFNGGTQNLVATFSVINGSEDRAVFGTTTFTGYAWQWDLSGVVDTITSVSVTAPVNVHSSVMGVQLEVSDSFAQAVPEPSTYMLIGLGIGALFILRRKFTAGAGIHRA